MYRVYTITIYDIRKYTIRIYTTTALVCTVLVLVFVLLIEYIVKFILSFLTMPIGVQKFTSMNCKKANFIT